MQLKDVATVKGGKRLPKSDTLVGVKTNHPYIRIRDMYQSYPLEINDKFEYITEDTHQKIKQYIVEEGDVIIAVVGNTIGLVSLIGKSLNGANLTENCDKIVNLHNYDNRFLYYFLKSQEGQDEIRKGIVGSSQPKLPIYNIERFEIPDISIDIQMKIVEIIEGIDKKIKTNEEINKNLEQQAQAIFKSWFVDFEPFGGVQPSEMQFIPLQELCKVVTKGTTPTTLGKSFTSSGINFIKAESILDNHSIDSSKFAFIDEETNALLKRSVIKANDIVFTIAGTLGRFAMVDNSVLPANINQAVAIIRPNENKVTPAYLYSFFIGNWHNEYYSKRIQQAVQANLSLTTIKSLPIAVLNNTTMSNYDELVSPLFALMKNNEEENRRLSKLRDTLLPKLMSGELNISDIDL